MLLIAAMMMLDYALTYSGIKVGAIIEANPLMQWLFTLPLVYGLIVRAGMILVICALLWLARSRGYYARLLRCIAAGYSLVFVYYALQILWAYLF